MTIWDDDAPELSIAPGDAVVEADNVTADFVVTAKVSPDDQVMVTYTLAESHDFISTEGTDVTENLDFRNDATEATLPIDITSDDIVESDGTITVTLTPDTRSQIEYTVAPAPDNTATINVTDDDSLPILAIKADNGDVSESIGFASFEFTLTGVTADTSIRINVTSTEVDSDFLDPTFKNKSNVTTQTFRDPDNDGTYTASVGISISNDSIGEAPQGLSK